MASLFGIFVLATIAPDYGYILIEIVVCPGKLQCHAPVVVLLLLCFVAIWLQILSKLYLL